MKLVWLLRDSLYLSIKQMGGVRHWRTHRMGSNHVEDVFKTNVVILAAATQGKEGFVPSCNYFKNSW